MMEKIDTSRWKEFRIVEVFEVSRPVARSQVRYEEGNVPFVASGNYNNGVVKLCKPKEGEELDIKGCISVSPLDGSAFYQPRDFLGRGGAGSAILLLRNNHLTELNGLFISTILRASLKKFSYNDQINSQSILEQIIKLPVTPDGKPDFAYMDAYMLKILEESETSLESLRRADKSNRLLDIKKWKSVKISDIFNVVKGTRLTKADMKPGKIKFIGSSAMNNGLTAMIGNIENLHPANTITVCYNGSVGETFYQDVPFWASDDVNVLYPKFNLNKNIALFIAPLIKAVSYKYNFVDKWKQEVMAAEEIKIPVKTDGEPDWEFMNSYMENILEDAKQKLDCMAMVVKSS